MNHTPGPWRAYESLERWYIVFDGVVKDATIAAMNSPCVAYDNAKADARLIAAAPELLEACKSGLESLISIWRSEFETHNNHNPEKADPAVEQMRAAIAKAEIRA